MKYIAIIILNATLFAFTMQGQTRGRSKGQTQLQPQTQTQPQTQPQQQQTQSVKINVTPASYIQSSVEQKMDKWLQKDRYESTADYETRMLEANKIAARKQFETEATARYKELFTKIANWSDLKIESYDGDRQAFLIQSAVCANFLMPVSRAAAQEFEAGFATFKKSNPDFYFDGDAVKFSRLTFTGSRGVTYVYDITGNRALANISWQLPLLARSDADKRDFKIEACIKSESQITGVSVVINGQTARGVSTVVNDGCDFTVNQTVSLADGMNELKIVVENNAGQSISDIRYVNFLTAAPVNVPPVTVASKRLALVIGNAAYSVTPLANPVNDATDIAAKLKSLGFEVMLLTDRTKEQMERAIDDFGSKAKGHDIALFFYAGHAIQYNGKNYLIPVNADLKEERDVEFNCTVVDRALARMEDSNSKLKVVVLDACRNNPFERSWRSVAGSGLSSINAPTGAFIAYSTAPGRIAQDGTGRNSPYTAQLLKKLDVKRLKIEDLFKQVREGVLEQTGGQQTPWEQSSITGEFYFNF